MIWSRGEILPEDGLMILASDRTFEHGLGLFETLRTWRGRAPLLGAHRARILRSAGALRLPIDPASFPDDRAVARLLGAEGIGGDRILRITTSGGSDATLPVVWMRSGPLPPPPAEGGLTVELGGWEVASSDPMARHKSLNYWSRRLAFEAARAGGHDEALSLVDGFGFAEGSRANLFVVRRDELMTPSLTAPIVPGVIRGLVLELARGEALAVREVGPIPPGVLREADEVFLTNAVRGIMPVARARGADPKWSMTWPSPGRWTARLWDRVLDRMEPAGASP